MSDSTERAEAMLNLAHLGSEGNISPELVEAICSEKGNEHLREVANFAERYQELMEARSKIVEAHVTTAVPMDDDLRAKVRARLAGSEGRHIALVEEVDPDILGGIIVEIDGIRQDASVRAQLRAIRKSLKSVSVPVGGEAQQ